MFFDPKWDKPKTPQQVLVRAADYIEQNGWARVYGEHGKARCAVGAIDSVMKSGRVPTQMEDWSLRTGARALLEHQIGHISIESWNDRLARTGPEVVQAMRAAARL
jgi:hypothetical protein